MVTFYVPISALTMQYFKDLSKEHGFGKYAILYNINKQKDCTLSTKTRVNKLN